MRRRFATKGVIWLKDARRSRRTQMQRHAAGNARYELVIKLVAECSNGEVSASSGIATKTYVHISHHMGAQVLSLLAQISASTAYMLLVTESHIPMAIAAIFGARKYQANGTRTSAANTNESAGKYASMIGKTVALGNRRTGIQHSGRP